MTNTITTPRADRPWAAIALIENNHTQIISWHNTEKAALKAADKYASTYYTESYSAAITGTPVEDIFSEIPQDAKPRYTLTRCECSHWYFITNSGTLMITGCNQNPSGTKSHFAQGHDAKLVSLRKRIFAAGYAPRDLLHR